MSSTPQSSSPGLIRGMGLWSATALNMIDMIGVGPFITMPLVLSAMGGRARSLAVPDAAERIARLIFEVATR